MQHCAHCRHHCEIHHDLFLSLASTWSKFTTRSSVFVSSSSAVKVIVVVVALVVVGVPETNPPPKVKSGVIKIKRNNIKKLDCDEKLFFKVVKAVFNQRRKMARNSLKAILGDNKIDHLLLTKRPEQLSVTNFIELIKLLESKIK